jgi:hypothetical protein
MPSTQNAVNNHECRSVPITALAESATNPRKRFDPKSLEELAASFKTQGILAPLLVRELRLLSRRPAVGLDEPPVSGVPKLLHSLRGMVHGLRIFPRRGSSRPRPAQGGT